MTAHTPPTTEELAKWTRYYVGDDPRNHGSLRHIPHTRYSLAMRRLITEVRQQRVALVREAKLWAKSEQEIGGHVAEIERLKAEVERLKVAHQLTLDELRDMVGRS